MAAVKHAAQIRPDDVVPRGHIRICDGAEDAHTGIVHENIKSAKAPHRTVHSALCSLRVFDVGRGRMNPFSTRRLAARQLISGRVQLRFVPRGDDDACIRIEQRVRNGQAYTARATGYEGDLSSQVDRLGNAGHRY
jgi:hypothetical protein